MITILLMAFSYILGSVPNALWIGKMFKGIDVREHGSKNTGSTNAARVLGVKLGILTLILDISKGLVPTLLAVLLKVDFFENLTKISNLDYVLVGICAILGHVFSIFMNFKGGKAVATTLGVFLVLVPKAILFAAIVFFVVFAIFRYVSLSSIFAAISLPIFTYFLYQQIVYIILGILIAILIVVKHKSNIERLKNGTESKFSLKSKK
ncbi:glycerol-3-phosphate 1-O-acyltransferase PlsY [Leptotrichia shahii]|uniref:glycerol-3-phosphate 1-O-acyltransferase PlsY n=1 Tax=Leptotrichia shahii TaxID=157691 RepID=UPI0028D788B3|nr:glycerol-3-phosphate 1-O-acyltransferase PlsY [Leptotrichia shahii]